MEIYRNEQANVDLLVPVTAIPGTFVVEVYDGSTLLHTFPTVAAITGGYRVQLPFSLVSYDRSFVVKWAFDYTETTTQHYTSETFVEVVTPYVTASEFAAALPEVDISPAEFTRLERRIRGVIDNYTGQRFGRYVGTRQTIGSGDTELKVSDRLIRLDNITGANIIYSEANVASPGLYTVRGDGWYVGFSAPTPTGDYVFENVIMDPDSVYSRGFRDNFVYNVTGVWGWETVPSQVTEAALILMEDELCPQSEYRDRYLKSISGDGWRYEYVPNAYYGTGSVIADQILAQFRYNTMTVI
jgi:hypothetical protein